MTLPDGATGAAPAPVPPPLIDPSDAPTEPPWQRLSSRMIWVDAVQTLLSMIPVGLVAWRSGGDESPNLALPLVAIALYGIGNAAADAARWVFTTYRVTDEYVERRAGILVRSYRSVQRDRIRTVDIEAKLRHRLSGLRVVKIGAGQQASAGESAFALDAVLVDDAQRLRSTLLREHAAQARILDGSDAAPEEVTSPASEHSGVRVLARLRPGWVIYNVFSIWGYVAAIGFLWGALWLSDMVGLDAAGIVRGLADWEALGWGWTVAIGVAMVSLVGAVALAVTFFVEFWDFELARVPGEKGTVLRTRQGMFKSREVNRDDTRMRGVQIAEPVLWRWMGMADTTVITTGLDVWSGSFSQPTAVLPRGPIAVALPVAKEVLATPPDEPDPLSAPLQSHPRAALRRRCTWATLVTASVVGGLVWLAATGLVPTVAIWTGLVLWPLALGAAFVAYRALGHAIVGRYLVVRSGLVTRSTAVLDRSAVSTIAISESVMQRLLGLRSVAAMTAAGYGAYAAPDVDAAEAVHFAAEAAPGLLDPFLVEDAGLVEDAEPTAR